MATDLRTFLDIYAQPSSGALADRDSYEFKYATAALLIACSKADLEEDAEEERVIIDILKQTFNLSDTTLEALLKMGRTVTDEDLRALADLVNDYYRHSDKKYLLLNLWKVADADGRIDKHEEQYIQRIAEMINMSELEIDDAHKRARKA